MALSGVWTGASFKGNTGWLKVTWEASQNIPENYSKITARLYFVLTNGTHTNGTENYSIWINGEQFPGGSGGKWVARGNGEHHVHTVTKELYHNADGTRYFALGATFTHGWTDIDYLNIGDKGFHLDQIPRVSKVSINTGFNPPWNDAQFIGKAIPIYTNRKSSAFTHTIKIHFGNFIKDVATGIGDSYVWNTANEASSLYAQIPNATRGVGTITCTTFYAGNKIGESGVLFALEVDKSINMPTFTNFTVVDTNDKTNLLKANSQFIQNVSIMKVTITAATAKNSSTIVGYRVVQGKTSQFENKLVFDGIVPTDTSPILVYAVDSRGYETKVTKTPVIYAYSNVEIESLTTLRENRTDTSVNLLAKISTTPLIIAGTNKNATVTMRWRYKESSSSTYTSWTALIEKTTNSSGDVEYSLNMGNIYTKGKSYDVQIEAYDRLTGTWRGSLINKGIPLIAFRRHGIGINAEPSTGISLSVGGPLDISGRVSIKGERSNAITKILMLQQIPTIEISASPAGGSGITIAPFTFSNAYSLGGGWNWSSGKAFVPSGARWVRAALQISVQRLSGIGYAYVMAFLLHKRADGTAIRYTCRGTSSAEVSSTANMHLQVGASQIVPGILDGDYFETQIFIWSTNGSRWQINGQQAQVSLEVLDYE